MVLQYIRSLIFNLVIYPGMLVLGLAFAPMALFSRNWAFRACHSWCRLVVWSARVILNLKCEVRGTPPTETVIVAAKHQSFLDIILIFGSIPFGKFVMKREILFMPIIGLYGMRIGCIPVNRGKRGAAVEKLKADVEAGHVGEGQLIIYPQGTRVAPGVKAKYKIGAGVIYETLGQPCVPVAVNCGYFWARRGIMKKPGTAIIEFLDPIEPGLPAKQFIRQLESVIEPASDKLLEEAKAND